MEQFIPIESIPSWYKTPRAQTFVLGGVFLLLFAAYTTIQFYAASTYGSTLASNSVTALYATFTLACFVSPGITNRWGSRNTMAMGILGGYVAFVVFSILYFQGICGPWIVILGGVLLGFGAALLWTAQGRLILQYASVADRQSQKSSHRYPDDNDNLESHQRQQPESGRILGTFWAVFQCSSLVGGAISFVYYFHEAPPASGSMTTEQHQQQDKPIGSLNLYVIFLSLMVLSAILSQLLLPPSCLSNKGDNANEEFRDTDSKHNDQGVISEEFPLLMSPSASSLSPPNQDKAENHAPREAASLSWMEEARDTYVLFTKNHSIQILAPLFFYTGFNQPYQQATFTRFFSKRAIGLELILFHGMEIIGAILCGSLLDRNPTVSAESSPQRETSDYTRRMSIQCLTLFLVVNSLGNLIAFLQERYASAIADTDDGGRPLDVLDIASPLWAILCPSLAFACWGWADSQIQVYCYWLMGRLFSSSDFSRAVAFYKCLQSLGYTLGFYLIPTTRLTAMHQLALSSGIFLVGTALSFLVLPLKRGS